MTERVFDQENRLTFNVGIQKAQRATQLGQGFTTFRNGTIASGETIRLMIRVPNAATDVQARISSVFFSVSAGATISAWENDVTVSADGTEVQPRNRHTSSVYDPATQVFEDPTVDFTGVRPYFQTPLGAGQQTPENSEGAGKIVRPGEFVVWRITSQAASNNCAVVVRFHEEPVQELPPEAEPP